MQDCFPKQARRVHETGPSQLARFVSRWMDHSLHSSLIILSTSLPAVALAHFAFWAVVSVRTAGSHLHLTSRMHSPSRPYMYPALETCTKASISKSRFSAALGALSSRRGRGGRKQILKTRATRNHMSAIALCATGLVAAHHPPRARVRVKEGLQFRVPILRLLHLTSLHRYNTVLCKQLRGLRYIRWPRYCECGSISFSQTTHRSVLSPHFFRIHTRSSHFPHLTATAQNRQLAPRV